MNIGDRIKQRRVELGLDAEDLAKRIGKSRATVYRYENGDIENMPTTVLEPIAKALNTTPADLMGWQPDTLASGAISLYNVHCETKREAEHILSYRRLSPIGQKKVDSYTNGILELETAELEVKAAHERTDIEVTDEMRRHDDDIMNDENF